MKLDRSLYDGRELPSPISFRQRSRRTTAVLREGLVGGDDPADLALKLGQRIEDRVTDVTGGRPELSPELSVARRDDLVCYGHSNPDGTFHIPSVPPGVYRVEIEFGPLAGGVDGVSAGARGIVIGATRR